MKRWLGLLVATLSFPAFGGVELAAVTYHDIEPGRSVDPYALPVSAFEAQMQYLKDRDYTPVSLALLERVRRGEANLPERAVLLTFDDGLKSFGKLALPVLEKYEFPAVLSVVTAWADGKNQPPGYQGKVMDWNELRRVARSPLVEVVSHTDNLHYGVRINRQGNEAPAVVARAWFGDGTVESEEAYRARVRSDLERAQRRFREELGRPASAIVWPFGENDAVTRDEARRLGMAWQLGLEGRPTKAEEFPRISRSMLQRYRGLADFAEVLEFPALRREQVRVIGLNLSDFAGKSDAAQEKLLSELLERVQLLRANAVIVTPFTADGRALFPTSAIPVASDVLSRVAHQLRSRAGIRRHLWVRVPKLPDARDKRDLIVGLARNVPLDGVIFDDPAAAGSEALRVLRHYHPPAKIGGWDDTADSTDLRLVGTEIAAAPDVIRKTVERWTDGGDVPTWFLVRRTPGTVDAQLSEALRNLRRAGARDYGYIADDYAGGAPEPIAVVREFSGRSIVNGAP